MPANTYQLLAVLIIVACLVLYLTANLALIPAILIGALALLIAFALPRSP